MIYFENLSVVNDQFNGQFREAFNNLMQSGRFILGPSCSAFEMAWARYCGVKNCVSLNSGTDALRMTLEAYGFDRGSKIVLSANSYIATILAVINAGLQPVFVDIDMSYNVCIDKLNNLSKVGVSAIMPTHMYGRPSNMVEIKKWAGGDIKIVADCCQAHGAMIDGEAIAKYADANAFSFYPTKNLGCLGDGGAVVTDDNDLTNRLRRMRFYGVTSKSCAKSIGGSNSRLDEFQAAVLLIKLEHFDKMFKHKITLAKQYCKKLNIKYINGHAYHIFAVRVSDRLEFRNFLINKGIFTDIHYSVPGYQQLSFGGNYPVTCSVADQIVSLPISYSHTIENVNTVCDAIAESCIVR